jgi:hypothetical protein
MHARQSADATPLAEAAPASKAGQEWKLPPGVEDAPNIGDAVRVVRTPLTSDLGWADREGTFYGFTTPSATGIAVIGLSGDIGFNVGFGEGSSEWFDPVLVERIGFDPAGTMSTGDRRFARNADGNWVPDSR